MPIPQVDPSIFNGIDMSYDASIFRFLCVSVGSLHILITNFWHWFGFISDFSILFSNHKPSPNSSTTTSSESNVNEVTYVCIGTFICYSYYRRNGDTVHSSELNDIGQKLAPKQ